MGSSQADTYVSYANGRALEVGSIEELAIASAASHDAGVERHWVRVRGGDGRERMLTRSEQLALLVAMAALHG